MPSEPHALSAHEPSYPQETNALLNSMPSLPMNPMPSVFMDPMPPFAGKALCQLSFAILFLQFLSACASGLTYLNNLAALVTSIGGPVGGQVVFVSLFSIANACGRLLFGHVSEHYLHTMGVPRTAFLAIAAVLSLSGSAALAVGAPLSSLYAVSLLMGSGCTLELSLCCVAAHGYAMLQLASALAAFVFASWLASYFASTAAAAAAAAHAPLPPPLSLAVASKVVGVLPAHGRALAASAAPATGGDGLECMGYKCYTPTFQVLVLLHVVSLCGVVWLLQSTKAQYGVIVATRKQQQVLQQQQPPEG
ncbi:hypothetical protein DUNSADRAFT_6664 [Dunaliella salina]|uniref:Uncharacterized protein n=1 Tax=Dunaliella salina TaxID=3046 RepID=A0ABQ7GMS0_DUNSA|nr:hypothetical protein DUNSADRAFT_6664 [Dunaliella salina]|eukprot:KAF5835907.1 hypothetical protein DUNSADRAFT_6664 [Dunaliella salina]